MAHPRLSLALDAPDALPAEGRVALFAPPGGLDLAGLPKDRLVAVQPLRPDHDALAARGVAVTQAAQGPYAAAVVFAPRAKAQAHALLAEAAATVVPGGPVWVDGDKTSGIDSLLKELRGRVALGPALPKAHGKIACFDADAAALADWAATDLHPVAGFVTRPGVFSADAVDEGSALLAAALPVHLPGRMADLGAGWGWLAAQVLAREGVAHLDLIEADAVALDCARRNISDPRAAFHWADATRVAPPARYDGIVMNPPFHTGREAEPALGLAFIAAAARMLTGSGILWMVANRHLPYADALAAAFAEVGEIYPPQGPSTRFRLIRASHPLSAKRSPAAAPKRSLAPRTRRR